MADYLYPLRSNENLQKEFITLLKQPGKNLAKLSDEVSRAICRDVILWGEEEEEFRTK